MRIFLFVYSLLLLFFFICLFVWKFDVLFVGLLVFFSYGNSKQTRSLLLLDLYHVTFIIGFNIHDQRIFFTLCDCRSEGVVPTNTLKRLVRKRKYSKYIL